MITMRLARRRPFALLGALSAGFVFTATAAIAAEPPRKPTVVPDRVIVVGELPPPAPEVGTTPAEPLAGRPLSKVDAYGVRRKPGEARFLTGSFIQQKFELYGNVANSALNVRIYTPAEFGVGRGFVNTGTGAVSPIASTSYEDIVERTTRRYELDLRKVAPERRLAVATQLLGEERGRDLVARFTRWETLRNKRLARR